MTPCLSLRSRSLLFRRSQSIRSIQTAEEPEDEHRRKRKKFGIREAGAHHYGKALQLWGKSEVSRLSQALTSTSIPPLPECKANPREWLAVP